MKQTSAKVVNKLCLIILIICNSYFGIGQSTANDPTLDISLMAYNPNGSEFFADFTFLNFNNNFSNAVDNDDVRKMMNTYDNLFIKNGTDNLVAERRKLLQVTDSIKVSTKGLRLNAPYKFEFEPSNFTELSFKPILIDKFLGTKTALSFTNAQSVNFTTTADDNSRAWDRFVIIFIPAVSNVFAEISAVRQADKSIKVQWQMQTEVNTVVYTLQKSIDAVNFADVANTYSAYNLNADGKYILTQTELVKNKVWFRVKAIANGVVNYSAIAMVNAIEENVVKNELSIAVYPTVVTDNIVRINFKDNLAGKYQLLVTNVSGKAIQTTTIANSKNAIYNLNITSSAKGANYVTVINEQGKKETFTIFIK
jgi:hypothetical protein